MFDAFIGIDWSGDQRKFQKGLKVAIAYPGKDAPTLVNGPGPSGRWSRATLAKWLGDEFRQRRSLVGLDFAFGFPLLPDADATRLDWDYVEEVCGNAANFYGGTFFRVHDRPHSPFINSYHIQGVHFSAGHLRRTELAAKRIKGATPQCVFNAVGTAQVGPSSISGMRFLRDIRQAHSRRVAIWPFDAVDNKRSLIVEIFPRYFPLSKQLNPTLKERQHLNKALDAFGSHPVDQDPASEDEGDALLSAAALRSLSADHKNFTQPSTSHQAEGWIFGVPVC